MPKGYKGFQKGNVLGRGNKGKIKKGQHIGLSTEFKKGMIPWIKGKHHTEGAKRKMSESLEGHLAWNKGKTKKDYPQLSNGGARKGYIPWNKNKTALEDTRIIARENSHFWKGGITPLGIRIRTSFKYRQWRCDVFTRDDFTCQECGRRGGDLEAHHTPLAFTDIMELNDITTFEQALNCEELWNINNGTTLCLKCHDLTKKGGKVIG